MSAKRTVRIALRAVTALVSAAALVATGFAWSVRQQVEAVVVTSEAAIPTPRPTPAGEAFTALLVGLDARTDAHGNPLPQDLLDAMHTGPDEGELHTDTIILLHVPGDAGQPAVAISIPRDSFVPIADGHGTHKINSAYRRGMEDAEDDLRAQGLTGAALDQRAREAGRRSVVATVEELTGTPIDHFAEIGMAGFVELTEAVGGVPVCLNEPVRDSYTGLDLSAGPHVVSGAGALAFVRQRHGLADGDLDRIARQQAFVVGLIQRTRALADPLTLQALVDIAGRHVVLDRGWRLDQAITQLQRFSGGTFAFHTIPTGRPDLRTPVDGIAVQIDRDAVRAFVDELIPAAAAATPSPTTPSPTSAARPTLRPPMTAFPTPLAAATPTSTPTSTPGPTDTATPTPTGTPSAEPVEAAAATSSAPPITGTTRPNGVPCVD